MVQFLFTYQVELLWGEQHGRQRKSTSQYLFVELEHRKGKFFTGPEFPKRIELPNIVRLFLVNEATAFLRHHPQAGKELPSAHLHPWWTDSRRCRSAPRVPQLGAQSKIGVSMDSVHTDQNRLHALNLFSKGKVIWGKIQSNYADSTSNANKKNSLIYSCKRILLVESTDTGNWQKYSEFSIYRRLGRSKGENILLEICLLNFFFNNSLEIGSTYEDF